MRIMSTTTVEPTYEHEASCDFCGLDEGRTRLVTVCRHCAPPQPQMQELIRVTRDGPIVQIDSGPTADLLEGVAAAAGVIVGGGDEIPVGVRMAAAALISEIRHPRTHER